MYSRSKPHQQSELHYPSPLSGRNANPKNHSLLLLQLIKPPQIHRPLKQRLHVRIKSLPVRILHIHISTARQVFITNPHFRPRQRSLDVPRDDISGSTQSTSSVLVQLSCPTDRRGGLKSVRARGIRATYTLMLKALNDSKSPLILMILHHEPRDRLAIFAVHLASFEELIVEF